MPQSPQPFLKWVAVTITIKSLTLLERSLGQNVGVASMWVKSWRHYICESTAENSRVTRQ